jgi:hypothetical protein
MTHDSCGSKEPKILFGSLEPSCDGGIFGELIAKPATVGRFLFFLDYSIFLLSAI